jgi:hypothetical protein
MAFWGNQGLCGFRGVSKDVSRRRNCQKAGSVECWGRRSSFLLRWNVSTMLTSTAGICYYRLSLRSHGDSDSFCFRGDHDLDRWGRWAHRAFEVSAVDPPFPPFSPVLTLPLLAQYWWWSRNDIDPRFKWVLLVLVFVIVMMGIIMNVYSLEIKKEEPPDEPWKNCTWLYNHNSKACVLPCRYPYCMMESFSCRLCNGSKTFDF